MGLMKTCDACVSLSVFISASCLLSRAAAGSQHHVPGPWQPALRPREPLHHTTPPGGTSASCCVPLAARPAGRTRDRAAARGLRKLRCFQGCGHHLPGD